jgi:hypothetical protein
MNEYITETARRIVREALPHLGDVSPQLFLQAIKDELKKQIKKNNEEI